MTNRERRSLPNTHQVKGEAIGALFVCMHCINPWPGILPEPVHRTPSGIAFFIRAQCNRPNHLIIFYNRAVGPTGCKGTEKTMRTTKIPEGKDLIRMSQVRLPKRILFGNLEGELRRGRAWEGGTVDHLGGERRPGVWHSGGL